MKKDYFLVSLLFFITISCKSQNINDLNIWEYISSDYVLAFSANSGQHEMIIPYHDHELYVNDNKQGEACLFALSETYSESWRNIMDDTCEKQPSAFAKALCKVRTMFSNDTSMLLQQMDMYLFFADKAELEELFIEEAEGGLVYNYYPKPGSTFIVYRYQNG